MTTVTDPGFDPGKFLDAHPEFTRTLRQFMTLFDAAEILGELQPPHGDTAAEFLREVGKHVLSETGIGDAFVEAMIRTRPRWDQ